MFSGAYLAFAFGRTAARIDGFATSITARERVMQPRTFDLTRRGWGHNFNVVQIEDGGQRLKLAVWMPEFPGEGDYLLMPNKGDTTRYQVDAVKPCWNPSDMAFLDVSFAPRQSRPA